MKKIFLSTVFIIAAAAGASAQQCQTVEQCRNDLSEASRMINKLLDVTKAQEAAIEALKTENAARERKSVIDTATIDAQSRLIVLLEKERRRKISFFFGLIQVRY